MPLNIPTLDDRKYQALLDEALARVPIHNPEWTNFNQSDPGVTVIEVFAFLAENLLYRANQIPERNRQKFLALLGLALQPASAARGLVTLSNERGPQRTITLTSGVEVRAGQTPFRTEQGMDVLPVEAQIYFKRKLQPPAAVVEHYTQLYASVLDQTLPDPSKLQFYQTLPFPTPGMDGIDLSEETADNSLWIALLLRASDKPYDQTLPLAREALAGKTLNLGLVPWLLEASRRLEPGSQEDEGGQALLQFEIVNVLSPGATPKPLAARSTVNVLVRPGVVQLTLPSASELTLQNRLEPLEAGVGDLPPALEDTAIEDRLITWLRLRAPAGTQARLWWAGINTVPILQRARIANERLPDGNGEPDQTVTLSKAPVLADSVRLTVTANGQAEQWERIEDLMNAGPEVPAPDPRQPPGTRPRPNLRQDANVFTLDAESGVIRFGDGARGRRPPFGSTLVADYDYSLGREGNVGPGAINTAPALPAGIKVTNPVPTWGGADAETAREGEKHIARYLQHRDRLVNATDFETITLRTPGVEIGRVEVLPAYNPELKTSAPGDAAGAVTLMIIPKFDPRQPAAPMPDRLFLDTICSYLDPRRLVTTEVFLRGPVYVPLWVSIGIKVRSGADLVEVPEAVKQALLQFLSPLPPDRTPPLPDSEPPQKVSPYTSGPKGWPLGKPVVDRELWAIASRVSDVMLVTDVLVAQGEKTATTEIEMRGLELPRVLGISVVVGEPAGLDQLRGPATPPAGEPAEGGIVPIPVIPEECR